MTTLRNARKLKDDAAEIVRDPVLSFAYIIDDLGISHTGFFRGPRRELPVVKVSARRFGVRQSDYLAWKAKNTLPARAA